MDSEKLSNNDRVKTTREDTGKSPADGPGGESLGSTGIVVLSIYLLTFTAFLGYSMVCFWAASPVTGAQATSNTLAEHTAQSLKVTIGYLGFKPFQLSYEVVLLVLIAICGALGAMVHCLRSLSWYIGNRKLRRSWVAKYIIQPFVGASLALIFYFVERTGFSSVQATAESTNLLGFAAVAGLVGLFSDQAVLKLKEIAEMLFAKPKPGADAAPQDNHQNNTAAAENNRSKAIEAKQVDVGEEGEG